jgi:hypothetical protein
MAAPVASTDADTLKRFLSQLQKAEAPHKERVERWRTMDAAYHGLLREGEKRGKGEVYVKYALGVVDTIDASVSDDKPILKLTPSTISPERIEGAKCLQELIAWERKRLGFNRERGLHIKQVLRRGISAAKIPWIYETIMQSDRQFQPTMGIDGQPGSYQPVGFSEPKETVTKQGAGYICVDVCDFIWDPGATKWDDVDHVFYRTYQTLAALRRMKKLGVYSWDDNDEPTTGSQANRDGVAKGRNVKDRVEVIERWSYTPDGVWLTVVANRSLVLRDCASPLRHGKLPFVVTTTTPELFTVEGMSEVELVMEEQAAIWELMNQSLENARWQNNATTFMDESIRGADDIVIAPGQNNFVNGDPNAKIKHWTPAPTLQYVQPLIEMLKSDMQSVSPANPYMSGADSTQVDNKTATGILAIQSMAQKRIQRKKEEILESDREAALQQVALNQQLLQNAVVWAVEDNTQPDGYRQIRVDPYQIQGEYDYDADEVADNVSQQQRRQEAANKLTTFASLAPIPGVAPMIDWAEVIKDFTEAYDDPPDRFLAPPPAPMAPGMVPPNGVPLNSAPPPGGGGLPVPAAAASPLAGGIGAAGPSLPPRPQLVGA